MTKGTWEFFKRSQKECTIEVSNLGLRSVIARLRDDELCPEHGGSIEENGRAIIECKNKVEKLETQLDQAKRVLEVYKHELEQAQANSIALLSADIQRRLNRGDGPRSFVVERAYDCFIATMKAGNPCK